MKKVSNKYFIFRCFISLFLGFTSIYMIIIRKNVIDSAIKNKFFYRSIFAFVLANLFIILVGYIDNYISKKVYIKNESNLMAKILNKYRKISVENLDMKSTKDKFEKAVLGAGYLKDYFESMSYLIKSSVSIFGTIFIIFSIDRLAAFILLLIICVFSIIEFISLKENATIWKNYIENMRLANYFSNVLINPIFSSERKIFNNTSFFMDKFRCSYNEANEKNVRLGFKRFIREFIYDLSFVCMIASFVLMFSKKVTDNSMTIGYFTSLFYQLLSLRIVISSAFNFYFNFKNACVKENGVKEFLSTPEKKEGKLELGKIYSIEFKDVHFSYPGSSEEVLKGVNLKLTRKSYGLIGENGSGKSTLTKLLMGLYEPTKGEILINGVNIKEYCDLSLLNEISVVMQNSYHYPATLRENFDFDGEKRINENLIKELGITKIRDKLKFGYDTNLGFADKTGVSLSGGEWQKIAIFRCLNKDSSLYILDEPNALLDPVSEADMYNVYREILYDKISLLISHRLGATKDLSEILILKDGKIFDSGTHQDLLKRNSYYKELQTVDKVGT